MDVVAPDYQAEVRRDLPREFLVDVKLSVEVAARQAKVAIADSHKAVEGGIALGVRRGNRAAGLIRYNVVDEAFEQMAARHGGELVGQVKVEGGVDGPKDSPIYLTTARFGATMVGFASHFQTEDLPIKNASRKALAAQNAGLGGDLFRNPEMYRDRERFVILMVRRDPFDIGAIASISVTLVDPMLTRFLMQVDINEFLASYGVQPRAATGVQLRRGVPRFRDEGRGGAEEQKSK